jgi:hypothetical protein
MNNSGAGPYLERRSKPRMMCDYRVLLQGRDGNGKKFKEEGRAVNMSRSGILVLLNRGIPECHNISLWVVLPTGILEFGSSKLATVGTVVRSEPVEDGAFGIAIKFKNYRLL